MHDEHVALGLSTRAAFVSKPCLWLSPNTLPSYICVKTLHCCFLIKANYIRVNPLLLVLSHRSICVCNPLVFCFDFLGDAVLRTADGGTCHQQRGLRVAQLHAVLRGMLEVIEFGCCSCCCCWWLSLSLLLPLLPSPPQSCYQRTSLSGHRSRG